MIVGKGTEMKNENKGILAVKTKKFGIYALSVLKLIFIGLLSGFFAGAAGTLFSFCLSHATAFRDGHIWIVYGLPLGGLAIAGLYKIFKLDNDKGTNLVLTSITGKDKVPFRMAPLIFVSTILTHFLGGSVGREGAALQLGGSLGNTAASIFKMDEKDRKIFIMSGMSAAFAALFGTPMAAAFFAIEVAAVGTLYISALLPSVVAGFVASRLPLLLGIEAEKFAVAGIPSMDAVNALKTAGLAVLCGLLSILFCSVMKYMKKFLEHFIKNPYVRIAAAAVVFIGITAALGTTDFYGAGMDVIERAVTDGKAVPYAFIIKLILTALLLGAGFKGGEIVPSLYVGATFGCIFGQIAGMSPGLCAAVGMAAVFCGVTNCPVASIFIGFELFGFECAPYILIAVAISFVSSGYYSLYSAQEMKYSKYKFGLRPDSSSGYERR